MDKVVLILESLVDFSEAYTEKRENLFPVMQKNRFDVRLIICAVQCGEGASICCYAASAGIRTKKEPRTVYMRSIKRNKRRIIICTVS